MVGIEYGIPFSLGATLRKSSQLHTLRKKKDVTRTGFPVWA